MFVSIPRKRDVLFVLSCDCNPDGTSTRPGAITMAPWWGKPEWSATGRPYGMARSTCPRAPRASAADTERATCCRLRLRCDYCRFISLIWALDNWCKAKTCVTQRNSAPALSPESSRDSEAVGKGRRNSARFLASFPKTCDFCFVFNGYNPFKARPILVNKSMLQSNFKETAPETRVRF